MGGEDKDIMLWVHEYRSMLNLMHNFGLLSAIYLACLLVSTSGDLLSFLSAIGKVGNRELIHHMFLLLSFIPFPTSGDLRHST